MIKESAIKRDSFIFYRSFFESCNMLPDEERLKAYDMILNYAINGELLDLSDTAAKAVFILVKPQIDANNAKFLNGTNGGAPKNNQNATKKQPKNNQKTTKTQPKNNPMYNEECIMGNDECGMTNENENENENNVDATMNIPDYVTCAREVKSEDEYIAEYTYTESMKVQSILTAFNIPGDKWSDVFSAIVSEFKQRDCRHKDIKDFDHHIRNMLMIWNSERGSNRLSTLIADRNDKNDPYHGLPKEYFKDGKLQYALNDRSGYR